MTVEPGFWKRRFGDRWHVVARDGGNRAEHKSTLGNSVIAKALAEGRPVVGIATSTSMLPSTLIASVDQTINLATPTGGTLKKVVERQLGRAVAFPVPSLVGIGLDIDDLAATFRPGSTSRQIVSRVERATTRKIGSDDDDRLPSLETAFEFGATRSWALDLAQDLEDRVKSDIAISDRIWRIGYRQDDFREAGLPLSRPPPPCFFHSESLCKFGRNAWRCGPSDQRHVRKSART